jgi:hypothetical protein
MAKQSANCTMAGLRGAPLVLGLCGLMSGAISGLLPISPVFIPSHVSGFAIHDAVAPVHVPLVFALVIGFGLWRWDHRPSAIVVRLLPFVVVAWLFAINTTVALVGWLDQTFGAGGAGGVAGKSLVDAVAGAAGGFLGASLTMVGCMLLSPSLRRVRIAALTVLSGAIAGLLFNPAVIVMSSIPSTRFIVLFMGWQAAVATCIGMGLARSIRHEPLLPWRINFRFSGLQRDSRGSVMQSARFDQTQR